MPHFRRSAVIILLAGLVAAPGPVAAQTVLDRFDVERGPTEQVTLASTLREVSGLAVGPAGRLFAHDDETAEIHELDPVTGRRLTRFGPGRTGLQGDFEGLAWADERFFLITSEGTLVEFPAGADEARVEYRRHVTGLGRVCDVEGLTHDARTTSLLISCKTMYAGGPPGIYTFDLARRELELRPRFAVRTMSGRDVSPSGIVVDPETGHLLIVAARERLVLELDATGRTIAERELEKDSHVQAEGIELLPDGTLVISDEGAGGRGRLAWYRPAAVQR